MPGRRKDDKLDCRWWQKLHKYGLLSASFRPSEEIRPLRSFHRQQQIAELDTEIESYLRMLVPLAEEEISEKLESAAQALPTGKHVPAYNVAAYVELLIGHDPTCLPGIGPQLALGLLAELGRDMTSWETDGHFGSYLALAPQPKISGGKVLSTNTRAGTHPAAALFKQAAAAVIRTDTALAAFYRRLAVTRGKGKALTALAYKIARRYYHLLHDGRTYVELGSDRYEAKYRQQQIAVLEKRAKRLGLTVSPVAA